MLDICLRYLALDEIGRNQLFSVDQMAIEELPQETDLFNESTQPVEYTPHCSWEESEKSMTGYDPSERGFGDFFVYASCYWLEHYGKIDNVSLVNLAGVENICAAKSSRMHNWIEQYRRPGCAIVPRFEFESALYDPLSITSLYGSPSMLLHVLQTADLQGTKYNPNTIVLAADQIKRWGNPARLRILQKCLLGSHLYASGRPNLP